MREILEKIMELAKANLTRDGVVYPAALIFKGKNLCVVMPTNMEYEGQEDQKQCNAIAAGILASKYDADYVALLWDAAFRELPSDTDPNNIEATELPLTYPKSMRVECLVMYGIPLPTGSEDFLIVPYKGGEGEPVEFLDKIPEQGIATCRFIMDVRNGYERGRAFIKTYGDHL